MYIKKYTVINQAIQRFKDKGYNALKYLLLTLNLILNVGTFSNQDWDSP